MFCSGWLWKVGGSGFKLRSWKRRYFVLTDDNCLFYFKSPKEMSALGMILLPSYTITKTDKAENPGNRQFSFKVCQFLSIFKLLVFPLFHYSYFPFLLLRKTELNKQKMYLPFLITLFDHA